MSRMEWERQMVSWEIKNFTQETISKYSEENPVKSDVFSPKGYERHFELYSENDELVLRIVVGCWGAMYAELSLKVIVEIKSKTSVKNKVEKNYLDSGYSGYFKLLKITDIPKLKDTHWLRLVINLEIKKWNESFNDANEVAGEKYYDNTMTDKIGSLFNSRDFSDVKIICSDGIEIPAHRGVLAMRSPVFKAMLTSDMVEQNSGTITIDDIDGETMQHMLVFLYMGLYGSYSNPRVQIPWMTSFEELCYELSSNLIYAADKYGLPALKKICAMNLNYCIEMEEVISILLTAEKFHEKDLKDDCLRFIAANFKELQNTVEWKLLDTALMTEIMNIRIEMDGETVALVNTL